MDDFPETRQCHARSTPIKHASRIAEEQPVSHEIGSPRQYNLRRGSASGIRAHRCGPMTTMCDSPKIRRAHPPRRSRGRGGGQEGAALTPSQRKRSEEEIILSAPASAQSAKSKDSPGKRTQVQKTKAPVGKAQVHFTETHRHLDVFDRGEEAAQGGLAPRAGREIVVSTVSASRTPRP